MREVIAAGDIEARPSELTTACGAAFVWAGLPQDAHAALAVALVRTEVEKRVTAHAMALVAGAVADFYRGDNEATRAAVERALDFATTSGLGEYHGIAPALAIKASIDGSAADAERGVVLARRATTKLGQVFALILAGDVLLGHESDHGRELLVDADRLMAKCPDPGINLPLLERVTARHRIARSRPVVVADVVEQLSERELAVLRYLPSTMSLPEIARELYVSPNTVKTQCSAIYRKLGVTSRREAVQAAREHHLL